MQNLSAFDETSAFNCLRIARILVTPLSGAFAQVTSEVCHGWTLMLSSSDFDSRTGLLELVFLRVLAKQKSWTMPRSAKGQRAQLS